MTALEVLNFLKKVQSPLLQTRDVADLLNITNSAAGKYLESLSRHNFVQKIFRGKWIVQDSNLDPLQIAEFITSPRESYISLHTALFYHGMIQQIPGQIYSVTIDRSRIIKTPMGVFSFHHCDPAFFFGYKEIKPYLKMATPEKALVDYFYFSPTKGRQFTKLPELEIPKKFSWKKTFSFCEMIPSKRTRSLVYEKIKVCVT
jgi:predicted transcriptional regulator of viral defense system